MIFTDLVRSVAGILGIRHGGTGNALGMAQGVILNCSSDEAVTMPRGSVVKPSSYGHSWVTRTTTASDPLVIGVVLGVLDPATGAITPTGITARGPAAVLTEGVTLVLVSANVSAGQFAISSATAGQATGVASYQSGAFGRFLEAGTAGTLVTCYIGSKAGLAATTGLIDPTTTDGDMIYRLGGTPVRLPIGPAAGERIVTQDGVPVWEPDRDIPAMTIAAQGDLVVGSSTPTSRGANAATVGANASASTTYSTWTPSLAFDGNDTTTWAGTTLAAADWLRYDFGVATTLAGFRLLQGNSPANYVTHYKIQGSADGTTWHDAYDATAAVADITARFATPFTYRYWRAIDITFPSGGGWAIASFELYPLVGGAATRLPVGAAGTVLHGGATTPSYSSVVNADIDAAAAIAQSKLALTYGAAGDLGVEAFGSAAAAGATGKIADAGHVHAMPSVVTQARGKYGSTRLYSVPGVNIGGYSAVGTLDLAQNTTFYQPFTVRLQSIAIDQLAINVTTASGTASTEARIGIYAATTDGQPTGTPICQGTVATDSTGTKTVTVSATLTPGNYVFAYNCSGAFSHVRSYIGTSDTIQIDSTLGNLPLNLYKGGQTIAVGGTLPSTPVLWDGIGYGTTGFGYPVFLRIV